MDAWFSVWIRIALAGLVFLPFLKFKDIPAKLIGKLMTIGGIQLGLMYCFYYQSFLLLSVPEVLLFTVFTPIYVTLIYDLLKGRFSPWYLLTAVIAVAGAAIIKFAGINENFLNGFLVVQGANICFALGQVGYKHVMEQNKVEDLTTYGIWLLLYWCVYYCFYRFCFNGQPRKASGDQPAMGDLIYLGLIASGLGYFLWNKGACLVNAGALAVMNNALVPAGLIVNIVIWNRDVDLTRLLLGGAVIMLSLWVNETWVKRKAVACNV